MLPQLANNKVFAAEASGQKAAFRMSSGFTLVELLVTLGILAILVRAGMPAMGRFVADGRISGAAAAMVTAASQARSEAISTGRDVSLYAVSARAMGSNMTTPGLGSVTAANAWSDGFRVLLRTRAAAGGALSVSGSQTTMLNQYFFGYSPTSNTSILVKRVTAGTNTGGVDVSQFSFNRNGQLFDETTGNPITNDIQIQVCDGGRTGEKGRRIVINNRGTIKNYLPSDSRYDNPCT